VVGENGFDLYDCFVPLCPRDSSGRLLHGGTPGFWDSLPNLYDIGQGQFIAPHVGQGFTGPTDSFFLDKRVGDFFGQQQNIADPFLSLRDIDAALPLVIFTPEAGCQGCAQGFLVGFVEAGQQVENGLWTASRSEAQVSRAMRETARMSFSRYSGSGTPSGVM